MSLRKIAVLLAAGTQPAVLQRLAPGRGSRGAARFLATVGDRRFTVRIDSDVLAWLRAQGKGYQSRSDAILRREMLNSLKS